MDDDSDMSEEEKMDSDDCSKQVSFSPEVEVLEIEPRQQSNLMLNAKNLNRLKNLRADGIKSRLGADPKVKRTFDNNTKSLHTVRKTVTMKPARATQLRSSKMKADQTPISVKSRLNVHGKGNKPNRGVQNGHKATPSSSVFNRLGSKH
jgi:hypothetical protein